MRRHIILCLVLLSFAAIYAQRTVKLEPKSTDIEQWISRNFGKGQVPPFSFVYDGTPSSSFIKKWKYSKTHHPNTEPDVSAYTITYTEPQTGFKVECDIKGYPQYGAVDWTLRFVNHTESNSAQISDVKTADISFSTSAKGPFRIHYAEGSTGARHDFAPRMADLQTGDSLYRAPHGGRSSSHGGFPFFNIETQAQCGAMVAIGWTGQWYSLIKPVSASAVHMDTGLEHFNAYLKPGERIRMASVCLLFWEGADRMIGHNTFRRFMLAHRSRKIGGKPVFYPMSGGFNWGDPAPCNEYTCVTTEYAIALMQRSKMFGILPEVFWMDAGWSEHADEYEKGRNWYNTAGTWRPDKIRYENGLRPVADYAHKLGSKFMVWFEPERVAAGSEWAQAHPEWLLSKDGDANFLLNLGEPDALKWLCQYMGDFMEESGIDYYRQDFNIEPLGFWRQADEPKRMGITEVKYIEGLYAYWDYLLERFPDMLIDNCASGGRRLDYETSLRSAPLWRTDYQYSEPMGYQCHTYGLNLYLPQHGTGAYYVDRFDFRSSMSSAVVFNWKFTQAGQSFLDMQKCIEEYKEVRPYYYEDYYPLSGMGDLTGNDCWLAYQLHKPSDQTGYVVAFRRPENKENDYTVRLSGLNAARMYVITCKDTGKTFEKSGAELLNGFTLHIDKPRASLLLKYVPQ